MQPFLSIVIPAYNEEVTLPACLDSLQQQDSNYPYEIMVVDNNSSDKTAIIARGYKVRLISEPRRGVCHARQAGLKAARGDIIISTDADCVYPAGWLNQSGQAFHDQPDMNLLIGNYRFAHAPRWANPLLTAYEWLSLQLNYAFNWTSYVSAANLAFRRADFSGYDTSLTQGGDELFVLNQLKQRGRVLYRFTNPVSTSSRRLRQGFWRTFYHDFLCNYLLNYWRTRRTGVNKAGSYAAHRPSQSAWAEVSKTPWVSYTMATMVGLVLLVLLGLLGRLATGHIHNVVYFICGDVALTAGVIAYATLAPHAQLAGPQPYKIRTKRKVVALTFDDGPNGQFSLDIAECLERYNGRGSFFQVGQNIARQPEITTLLHKQGHLIGNHSANHRIRDYFMPGWRQNLVENSRQIELATGQVPRFMRLPWLFRTPWLLAPVYALGLQPVAGTFLNLREWRQPDGLKMARQFAGKVHPGDIIIMHDGYNASGADRQQTVRAVAELCRRLQARGFSFVRLDEML